MKKIRTAKLSFSQEELNMARLSIGMSGICAPNQSKITGREYDYSKYDYSNPISQMNFGFLGNVTSSANDYHKDLTAHDLVPKAEDFVKQNFRMLSATTVASGSWRATDFSKEGVLKKSMKKLLSKPLYKNHDTDIENWVGLVEAVSWSDGYIDDNGNAIPGGIDGLIAIDAKTNPKIARGVLAGAIYANSVTVEYSWEPSHPFEDDEEFISRLGSIGPDGKEVRRVATEIADYYESSLVWIGADPYARALDTEGKLVLPEMDNYSKGTLDDYKKTKSYSISLGMDKNILSLSAASIKRLDTEDQKQNTMNEELAKFLREKLGLAKNAEITVDLAKTLEVKSEKTTEELTEDKKLQLSAFDKFKGLKMVQFGEDGKREEKEITPISDGKVSLAEGFEKDNVVLPLAKLQELETKVTGLETEKTALTARAEVGDKFLKLQREEAIRLYKLAVPEADENVVSLFNEAKPEAVEGLLKQYAKGATQKFGGKCKDCGSTEFTFQSSVNTDGDDAEDYSPVDFDSLHEKYSKKNRGL